MSIWKGYRGRLQKALWLSLINSVEQKKINMVFVSVRNSKENYNFFNSVFNLFKFVYQNL